MQSIRNVLILIVACIGLCSGFDQHGRGGKVAKPFVGCLVVYGYTHAILMLRVCVRAMLAWLVDIKCIL